jgi:gamma-tubulin complex component 3
MTLRSGTIDGAADGATGAGDLQAESGLTLRRLDVWLAEWRLRMRMMSVVVEGAHTAHGGALVSLIHSYTATGDPFVRAFTAELLEDVAAPLFAALRSWLFGGALRDPFGEFFVVPDATLAVRAHGAHPSALAGAGGLGNVSHDGGFGGGGEEDETEGARTLWENKYRFRKEMLPAFVSEAFGRKVGRRFCLHEHSTHCCPRYSRLAKA